MCAQVSRTLTLKKKNKRKKVVDNEIEWARKDQCPHIAET